MLVINPSQWFYINTDCIVKAIYNLQKDNSIMTLNNWNLKNNCIRWSSRNMEFKKSVREQTKSSYFVGMEYSKIEFNL